MHHVLNPVVYECTNPQVEEAYLPTLLLRTAIATQEVQTTSVVETVLFGKIICSHYPTFNARFVVQGSLKK